MNRNSDYSFAVRDTLTLNNGAQFTLEEQIKRGLGYSFRAGCLAAGTMKDVRPGETYFLKMPKVDASTYARSARLAAVRAKFIAEFEKRDLLDEIANSSRSVARMYGYAQITSRRRVTAHDQPEQLADPIPVVIHEYIPGETLEDWFDSNPMPAFKAWYSLAHQLGTVIKRVHNQGILHGWLLPRNVIRAEGTGLVVVGFGYAALIDSAPPAAVSDEHDLPFRAPELRETPNSPSDPTARMNADTQIDETSLGALWVPADIFSLGALIFRFATGANPKSELPVGTADLKRDVFNTLRDNNLPLLISNENVTKIIDKCLRHDPEDRYGSIEEFLDALEDIASDDMEVATPLRLPRSPTGVVPTDDAALASEVERAIDTLAAHGSRDDIPDELIDRQLSNLGQTIGRWRGPAFFSSIAASQVNEIRKHFERMKGGHFEIYGHRDVLISSLCKFISTLRARDEYCTMTLPSYWTDENLGSNGRFLTMNKHIARRGVKIRRLFLVSGEFFELPRDEQEVLEWQRQALEHWRETPGLNAPDGFEIKVLKRTDDEIRKFERTSSFVAYIRPAEPNQGEGNRPTICLNFISHGKREHAYGRSRIVRQIKKIRFWSVLDDEFRKKRFNRESTLFDAYWEESLWLDEFIRGPGGDLTLSDFFDSIDGQLRALVHLEKATRSQV